MTYWRMTEPPGGAFQSASRHAKTGIPYSASMASLLRPGEGGPFFEHRPRSLEALAVELARLAYCYLGDSGIEIETALRPVGLRLEDSPYDDGNTQAYIAASDHLRVLVFRGSDDLRAWQTNIRTRPVPWPGPGLVHEGFAEAFEACWPQLAAIVATKRADSRPLIVTGHSLGGALATLAAARVHDALLYSFGAPRVGNRAFAFSMDQRSERLHRYINYRDPVPLLPPGLLGYRHCGRGYYIAKDGRVGALPPARRRNSVRDMRVVLDRLVQAINEPDGARNDLTDHAALNYVSSLR